MKNELLSNNVLKPLNTQLTPKRIVGFDIETHGVKNDFLMASVVYDKIDNQYKTELVEKVFYSQEDLVKEFLDNTYYKRDCLIFATNLQFDILGAVKKTEHIRRLRPLMREGRMISAKLENDGKEFVKSHGKTYTRRKFLNFYDTMSFANLSVSNMAKILGMAKLEKPSFLGEYPEDKADWKILKEYNLKDSYITFRFAQFLQKTFNDIGCDMKMTIPSTSMDLFRRKYLDRPIKQPRREVLDYLYKGYYGGRTEAIKRGRVENVKLYDINSLYPAAMAYYDYPDANYVYKRVGDVERQIMEYEGIADVTVKCPSMHLPYLPLRDEKLIFPIGEFRGHYTHFELRTALKLGYKLLDTHSSVYYTRTHKPFTGFINDLYGQRLLNKKSPLQLSYKLLMNSLYGKFGQKYDNDADIRHISSYSPDEFMKVWNGKNEVKVINDFVYNKVLKDNIRGIGAYINPIYSAYITAYARTILYNSLPEDVYYMDTDSCITKETLETGQLLGEWKLEDDIKECILVKPKMYLKDEVAKVKGASRMDKPHFLQVLDGSIYEYERFVKYKEAIRRELDFNQRLTVQKSMSLEDNKREWPGLFDKDKLQTSKPLKIVL